MVSTYNLNPKCQSDRGKSPGTRGLGLGVSGLGFRVCRAWGLGFRIYVGFRVLGLGFRVWGLGLGVLG